MEANFKYTNIQLGRGNVKICTFRSTLNIRTFSNGGERFKYVRLGVGGNGGKS